MVSPRILTRNVRKFDCNRTLFPGRLHDVDVWTWSVCLAEKQAAPQAETGPTWWTQVLNAIKCHENRLIHIINIILTPVVVNDIVMCMWCAVMLNIPILFDRLCRSDWAEARTATWWRTSFRGQDLVETLIRFLLQLKHFQFVFDSKRIGLQALWSLWWKRMRKLVDPFLVSNCG